jgi:nicotinamide riboside kinase
LASVDAQPDPTWPRPAKIAFIGSHGVRKTAAVASFAATLSRAGRSWELVKEVVRHSPLGINETATPEAQLWVLVTQVQQELELAHRADVLIADRSVIDNFAYMLRAAGGADPFCVEPLLRCWAPTYDLLVRLLPDVTLRPDGVRSTNDAFRDEIEAILDARLPDLVASDRLLSMPASAVTRQLDWRPVAQRLADVVGGRLFAEDGEPPI